MKRNVIPIDRAAGAQEPPDDISRLRVPPHSAEAEQAILGAILQWPDEAIPAASEVVSEADFYRLEHRLIYAAALGLAGQGCTPDIITVFEALEQANKAEDAGGLPYLNDLLGCVATAANVRRYAEVVADRASLRRLIAASDEIATAAFNANGRTALDLLDGAKVALAKVSALGPANGARVPMLSLDALRQSSAAVQWLCKGVVPADSIGMLFGGSGTFKSYIALDLALHVAHGMPWMGRKTRQGAVIFIAAEGGSGLWTRIQAWHKSRNLDWRKAPVHVVPVAVDLTADAWRVVEAAQMLGIKPELVIVDTLSQTYSGEENSANEMAAYLRAIGTRFRALWHCAVVLVHHSGHAATERPRGSSAIRANIDFLLGAFRDEKEMLATLACVKQKDAELFEDATFQLTVQPLGVDADGDPMSQLVARHLSSAEEVQQAAEAEVKAGRGGKNQMLLSLLQNGMQESELRKLFMRECGDMTDEARRQAYSRSSKWARSQGFYEVAEGFILTLKR